MADPRSAELVARVEALLPQTQCRRCGYAGCQPYAEAVVVDEASINLCPPGGETVRRQLAHTLGRALLPASAVHTDEPPCTAQVREATCIGCTKCIQACPVDAIIGALGVMHTVVAGWCTGCGLCLPPCPTDCIDLLAADLATPPIAGVRARERHLALQARRESMTSMDSGATYVRVERSERSELNETVLEAVRRRRDSVQ